MSKNLVYFYWQIIFLTWISLAFHLDRNSALTCYAPYSTVYYYFIFCCCCFALFCLSTTTVQFVCIC